MNAAHESNHLQIATLGGGCFWCFDPLFAELRGVARVEVGYAGGDVPNPSYQAVCTGSTGHAEVVQVSFDPAQISFKELLEIFFTMHDPTTLNRQGADVGTQYRSIILYHDEEQKRTAEQVIDEINQSGIWGAPIVTRIEPFVDFYRAEEYHQDYFNKNPHQGYCMIVIAPKVVKFRKKFVERLKTHADQPPS
jgi:peptide-methionine (S)-S-oxide reductase